MCHINHLIKVYWSQGEPTDSLLAWEKKKRIVNIASPEEFPPHLWESIRILSVHFILRKYYLGQIFPLPLFYGVEFSFGIFLQIPSFPVETTFFVRSGLPPNLFASFARLWNTQGVRLFSLLGRKNQELFQQKCRPYSQEESRNVQIKGIRVIGCFKIDEMKHLRFSVGYTFLQVFVLITKYEKKELKTPTRKTIRSIAERSQSKAISIV